MSLNIITRLPSLFAAVLTAVFLILAFPMYDLGYMAWLGLVPLLLVITDASRKKAFLLSLISGVIFFTAVFSWTFEIPRYKLLHHAVLGLYLGLYFGVFGLICNLISRRCGLAIALLLAPFFWVSLEYARSNFFFLALPWALLAHSQYKHPLIIQFASLTGAYGISFLVVLVNSALALTILTCLAGFKLVSLPDHSLHFKAAIAVIVVTATLTGLALFYGNAILSRPEAGREIKLSVLQGNIDRKRKANPKKHTAYIMQIYENLTKQALVDQPDLIIWPEASTPGYILKDLPLYRKVNTLIKEAKTPFLIGSSEYPKFIKDRPLRPEDIGNTALYFSSEGKFLGQYLKIHLVPFGEQIPYEGIISWPSFIVPEDKKTYEIPGREYTVFKLGESKFSSVICWEVVFPNLFREFVKRGANFMVNLTNEGWFGDSAAPYQMAAINAFRAVENRVPVARAANTGISCFIDQYGRITGRVSNSGKDIFVEGYLTHSIRASNEKTFYTRYGDIFIWACLLISMGFLLTALLFKSRALQKAKGDVS